ncbi:MAG: hypothetical protein IT381_28450 [Deltaproteobacteria bacterium]|nr:hypothetical protein [Deltaproteobacteria bacterium]
MPTIVSGVKSTAETAGGTVTFQWSILSSPVGSAPKIRPVIAGDEREVVLVTDKDGDYVIGLVLIVTPTDGGDVTSSALDTVTVHARLPSGPLSVSYVDPSQIAVGSGATKLNVSGTNFACTSVIQVGGVALPTELGISGNKITALSASLPSSMLSTLALLPVTVSTGDQVSNALSVMTYAPLAANALLYEPAAGALYATLPSKAGVAGNMLVRLDAANGGILASYDVGAEPDKMILSADGQHLFVSLAGSNVIRRFAVASTSVDLELTIGAASGGSPYRTARMLVLSDQALLVVATDGYAANPSYGATIYDGAVARPSAVAMGQLGGSALALSSDEQTAYVAVSRAMRRASITASGISIADTTLGVQQPTSDLVLLAGRLFSAAGDIIDPSVPKWVASLMRFGSIAADPPTARIFFLDNGNPASLAAFSTTTLELTGEQIFPSSFAGSGSFRAFTRCGSRFAFVSGWDRLFVFEAPNVQP